MTLTQIKLRLRAGTIKTPVSFGAPAIALANLRRGRARDSNDPAAYTTYWHMCWVVAIDWRVDPDRQVWLLRCLNVGLLWPYHFQLLSCHRIRAVSSIASSSRTLAAGI